MRILIMGLPGSGKTTLARALVRKLGGVQWLNADAVRKLKNDWDFSPEGRLRQATRIRAYADTWVGPYTVADFVAALPEQREIYDANFTVWMNTIPIGRFEDTNKAFVPPEKCDIRFDSFPEVSVQEVFKLLTK